MTVGYLRLKSGYVEAPRTWNRRTTIAALVHMACGYPKRIPTEPEFIPNVPEEVSALRQAVLDRICETVEHIAQSAWAQIAQESIDVTRTDRRGRYLRRPV
ncbi:hypothetical protein STRATTON_218 [Erwinia phage vB_EamM_Stratton]|uniref:Uncharacterized protein n=1 Tax=Erwinia phage vB_EamM_Stratton TaxID=1883378 RepID=A0A1B2IHD6_9CAUD|nr:hypothetical protein STRATTON_218 [Erwinia phage vB_EamM_Stratton]